MMASYTNARSAEKNYAKANHQINKTKTNQKARSKNRTTSQEEAFDWNREISLMIEDPGNSPSLKSEIKWLRENKGLSLYEASTLASLNPMFLQQLESGERKISEKIILKLIEVYGNPPDSPFNQHWAKVRLYNAEKNRLRYGGPHSLDA